MDIGYIAVETFVPTEKYLDWSRLYHVRDVVSFDVGLCPRILRDYTDEDYLYLIWMDEVSVFRSLDWLIDRVSSVEEKQILAVAREPQMECARVEFNNQFRFYGYDLIEEATSISALTNCGGFDKAFQPSDLTEYGLIKDFERAKEIQTKLHEIYPYEDHAQCGLWAIWRME